ncbi:hypothetical protein ETD83_12970 [Actinomadura soli]|uniref:DUF1772 domain-containing protein n=1 Tax=Actinomadura soli TaxID=2508997 RepID=A0A5C4JDK2_9ACTN|nr:hypothetical protein [Actinomadura soli]TMR02206.1 hypothetical protein ETD83_12970 [Actinomadura soli]
MASGGHDPDDLHGSLNHAWAWYTASMGYRMQAANLYLFAIAGYVAAYIASLQAKLDVVAGFCGLAASVSALVFALLGKRSREYLAAAAAPLAVLQDQLAQRVGVDELRMVERVTSVRPRWRSTAYLGNAFSIFIAGVFLSGSLYAFLR